MEVTNQYEQIDNYLSGRMGEVESVTFEKELASNPELSQELGFQKSIIEGVKVYRKSQIKAHLQTIDVTTGLWESIVQSTAMKATIGVLTSAAIGTAAYFYFTPNEVQIVPSEVVVQEIVPEAEAKEALPVISEEDEGDAVSEEITTPRRSVASDEKQQSKSAKKTDKSTESKNTAQFTPQIQLPDADMEMADAEFESESISADVSTNPSATRSEMFGVEIIESSGPMMYTFYDSKLSLFGNFESQPYEILEINRSEGKSFYLTHKEQFYALNSSKEKVPLVQIDDPRVIQELKILKGNK